MSRFLTRVAESAFDLVFGDFRWYRRMIGGHWERATVTEESASGWGTVDERTIWRHVEHCSQPSDGVCEDYPN